MVSGLNFSWFSQQYIFKIQGHIQDFRLKLKKIIIGGLSEARNFLVSRFHAKIVFFLFVGRHTPQTSA
jgi:hypothetical protein